MNQQIRRLCQILQPYTDSPVPDHVRATVEALSHIERRKAFIKERMERGLVGRVLNASTDATEIISSLREFSFAVDLFQMDTLIHVDIQTRETNEYIQKHKLFDVLNAVPGARFDESTRNGCMDGTRVDTLAKLFSWAADRTSQPILWLSGMAGIGKSAIAHSFCQKVLASNRLGASFFCSRQSENLSNVGRVLPTIAYQLAFQSQAYRDALIKILRRTSQSSYGSATLQKQAQDLFIDLKDHLSTVDPLIVVIDALDECSHPTDVSDLLRVVLRSGIPIKFLITSRPETHIDKGFSTEKRFKIDMVLAKSGSFLSELLSHASLRLHDAEADVVEEDIFRYLKSELFLIMEDMDENTAGRQLRALAKKSGSLFIFAFTAVQYISDSKLSLSQARGRLSIILGTSLEPRTKLSTHVIDGLYREILESAHDKKENFEIDAMRAALDTLLCLHVPQPISVISALLGSQQDDVRAGLENFSSVLNIPKTDDKPVLVFHASFPDYILDAHRSGSYALVKYKRHLYLAAACLKLMNGMLHKNMCSIPRRQTPNANIDKSVIQTQIPPVLYYTSVYWASHLDAGAYAEGVDQSLVLLLHDFVNNHLLHWLECLSLLKHLHVAYNSLQQAHMLITHHAQKVIQFNQMQNMLLDAQYMLPQIYYFVKLHALEVYFSALMWLPTESVLRAKYLEKQPHQVILGLEHYWGSSLQVLHNYRDVSCMAFSPDGVHIACGSGDNVQIWSLETWECVKWLRGHRYQVKSVAYFPDGSKLVSGSTDKNVHIWNTSTGEVASYWASYTAHASCIAISSDGLKLACEWGWAVQIWDVSTGRTLFELGGHTDSVSTTTFSPNGSKLASGSADTTINVWNASTGEFIHKLISHTGTVLSVAFSPDGIMLASGSNDKTVWIWNADTGEAIHQLDHTGWVKCIVFSFDGLKLATGSFGGSKLSGVVQIWDIYTRETIYKLAGQGRVDAVAFSTDGLKLASVSNSAIVQIWNAHAREPTSKMANYKDHTGSLILSTDESANTRVSMTSHKRSVLSIAFSSNGSTLASGSEDNTVQIWNANTGKGIHKLTGHTGLVYSVTFSPDGSKLASGDKDVYIWNASTGKSIHKLTGHKDSVLSVAFSPDGSTLASGTGEGVVHIWNADTGEAIHRLCGHTGWINFITFSPDGLKLASGSNDKTVRVWNVYSGESIHKLTGHTHWVDSVAFSPHGSTLASGSSDQTVQIWDAYAGESMHKLIGHKHTIYCIAFTPDGSRLVSGSYDKIVQIWDPNTGELIQKLMNYMHPIFIQSELMVSPQTMPTPDEPQSRCILLALYQPIDGQYAVAIQNDKLEMEPLFWMWGSNIQPGRITKVAYTHGKMCIGYKTGKVVIIKLAI